MNSERHYSLAKHGTLLALTATSAQAGVVVVNNVDVTFALGQGGGPNFYWDIDGNGVNDFRFDVSTGDIYSRINFHWKLNSGTNNNVLCTWINMLHHEPLALSAGKAIGPGLPTNYTFSISPEDYSTFALMKSGGFIEDATQININPYPASNSTQAKIHGDFYLGFRFDRNGEDHYAWAKFELETRNTSGEGTAAFLRLYQWAWNDVADETILAGQIPEPATVASGLGMLALGAAGLRRWRKRK